MTDKISGQRPPSLTETGNAPRSRAVETQVRGDKPAAASPDETTSLTRQALMLRKLEELLASAPAEDAGRIAAIKQAIESGTYEIDDQAIAEKMLRLERDLS